jgi:hypothetical protein
MIRFVDDLWVLVGEGEDQMSDSEIVVDPKRLVDDVSRVWDEDLVGQLSEYVEIPAKSPAFDAAWAQTGLLDLVVQRAADWVIAQRVPGLTLEIVRLPGRDPCPVF